ncbi:glycosyltransferase family 39 protein [Frondihabitans australicus]|uniref:Mannosyltransferase n=1 Tax=Frondihabitans australicus TaxID=386892 RepID=A0A495IIF0_9MICO|nr:glycosyltransferase family 39 protein [Frondihabitans australicus]RKR75071.1 mannosyltransferase [Frondihabitans australicus]
MIDLLDSTSIALPTVERRTTRAWRRLQRIRSRPWGDPALAGVFGLVVSVAFSWVPSVWYDESATVVSAERTYGELWAEIHHVDAVHAVYYALMHAWFALVGYSPFSLRLPSAVAIGVGAALVVLLARELTDRRTGLVAGLLFVLLPRITWAGTEGRSYATATALATALTLVFVHASKRSLADRARHRRWWTLYGVLALLSTAVFLYSALVVVAHGIALALWARRSRRASRTTPWKAAMGGWLVSAGIAGLLLIPLAKLSSSESHQIGWISKPSLATVNSFLVTQWFTGNDGFAWFGWALAAVGVVAVVRKGARYNEPNVLQVALPWLLVPALGLIAVSIVSNPLYSPRYVTEAAPAIAILMAVGLTSLRLRPLIALGLVAALGLSVPTWVQQRMPEAKDDSSWAQVASLVKTERAAERKADGPGVVDSIVYGYLRRHPTGSARNIAYSYPSAFTGMVDVTLKTPAAQTGELWETRYPLSKTIDRVDGSKYVWLVTSNKQDLRPSVTKALATEGYHVINQWHLTRVNIVRYAK